MESLNTKNVAIIAISVLLGFVVVTLGIVRYNIVDREKSAETANLCIDAGGTWIAQTKSCIR